jgi:hypothetical protein
MKLSAAQCDLLSPAYRFLLAYERKEFSIT